MLRKKQKGQSLVEFALVLPILLLLLLGVVEAARVVWSYITVQAAAREAARYAITGRPNVTTSSATICQTPENLPNGEPWICSPEHRATAVKAIAHGRGQTLAVSQFCEANIGQYTIDNDPNNNECGDVPGAFGIAVYGQYVDSSTDPVQVKVKPDYAGDQGLNVTVATYYNIEMIDPIFDTIMGGNFIRVRGEVQMQNEGLDQSLGFPPPPIPDTNLDGVDGCTTCTPNPTITDQNGNTHELNGPPLDALLQNHTTDSAYDIILKSVNLPNEYTICDNVSIGPDPNIYNCSLDAASGLTEGDYILYSKKDGGSPAAVYGNNTNTSLSPDDIDPGFFVKIVAGVTPRIEIAGGNVWAARSTVTINLINHDVADETFDIYYQVGNDTPQAIPGLASLTADPGPQQWKIPSSITGCPQNGAATCTLFSVRSADPPPTTATGSYARTTFFVNQPKITLSQGVTTYPQGALMQAFLEGHTPNHTYDVRIEGTGVNELLDTVTTDSFGQYSVIEEFILNTWPDGTYQLRSYEPGATVNPIGEETLTITTPSGPFITVDGGYTWPINSFINIRVHQHPAGTYYLKFGNNQIQPSPGVNTFAVDSSGTAVVGYRIPKDITTVQQTFKVASFDEATNTEQASRDVTVVPVPLIQVLEGDTVLPNSEITIRLSNHSPNSSYAVYFGKEISDDNSVGKRLLTLVTDINGVAERTYDLATLPPDPAPDFSKPNTCQCYGKAYHMYSQALNNDRIAFTQLTIDSADLAITKIEVPPNAKINTTVPVTLTIQNLKPVTINRYFDIDLYLNPSPLVPAYSAGRFNFPGDVKYWENFVAPNGQAGDTFTIRHDEFFVGQYGDQDLYGYADTTNVIVFENDETNNIGHTTVPVVCVPNVVTSDFTWLERPYGSLTAADTKKSIGTTIELESKGLGTTGPNDDATDKGHYLLYLNKPITTTAGFEVVVRVTDAPQTEDFAKGGIQLRNGVNDPQGLKIEFDLAWNDKAKKHRIQVSLRNDNGSDLLNWKSSSQIDLKNNPVWLRIKRDAGSDTFNFYYAHRAAKPTDWGNPYSTASVPMEAPLIVGLFNASGSDNKKAATKFDNFSYTDASNCIAGIGQPAEDIPPGLTICTDLLEEASFENAPLQKWRFGNGVFSGQSEAKAHSGFFRLVAPTFDSGFKQPFFYQEFTMPTFVYSTTTGFNLTMYRNIDSQGTDDPADRFYAVIATTPSTATGITTPTLVAEGVSSGNKWTLLNNNLIVKPGTNLESYAGQKLNLYLYNDSNAGCVPNTGVGCHKTTYDFDDVGLVSCTTQPPPAQINTVLRGTVTLHRLSAGSAKLPGVKVWAYAEDGDLYETFTAADGSYTFYNMPADNYVIYSEYNFINPVDPTQIETLATNTEVTLNVDNNASKPLVVNLDLYTVF